MKANITEAYLISIPVKFRLSGGYILRSNHILFNVKVDGIQGLGSGVLYRSWPNDALKLIKNQLLPSITGQTFTDLRELRKLAAAFVETEPAISYALDSAVWDIQGKLEGKSVATLLGGVAHKIIPVTEQVFITDSSDCRTQLDQIVKHGTKRVKLKLGLGERQDIAVVEVARSILPEGVELHGDFNRAYELEQGIKVCRQLKELGLVSFEEPIKHSSWNDYARFRDEVAAPVMLDESILNIEQLVAAVKAKALDTLNFKLTRIGGISQALEYKKLCESGGIGVSVGCSEDLGAGMASIVQFAAAIQNLKAAEGIGAWRLGCDYISENFKLEGGNIKVGDTPGLGVTFNPERLSEIAKQPGAIVVDPKTAGATLRLKNSINKLRQRSANARLKLVKKVAG